MSLIWNSANPLAENVARYPWPGGILANRYRPTAFVVCAYFNPVVGLVRVTSTPGMAAPEESVTKPVMPEACSCARQKVKDPRTSNAKALHRMVSTLFPLKNRIGNPPEPKNWTGGAVRAGSQSGLSAFGARRGAESDPAVKSQKTPRAAITPVSTSSREENVSGSDPPCSLGNR